MSNLPLTLEFRDGAPHFCGPIGGQQYSGHEWIPVNPDSSCKCCMDECTIEAYWNRITVSNLNDLEIQFLCKDHGAIIWDEVAAMYGKYAVLCVRDWDDETVPVIYEQEAPGAEFPGLQYLS